MFGFDRIVKASLLELIRQSRHIPEYVTNYHGFQCMYIPIMRVNVLLPNCL